MKPEVREILEKQAAWQASRARRSWGDKIRDSLVMRAAVQQLRKSRAHIKS